MEAIEALEDVSRLNPILAVPADLAPATPAGLDGALDASRLREILRGASGVLADAADRLYSAELEQDLGKLSADTPDDDRAAGRLDHVRLDLLSE